MQRKKSHKGQPWKRYAWESEGGSQAEVDGKEMQSNTMGWPEKIVATDTRS